MYLSGSTSFTKKGYADVQYWVSCLMGKAVGNTLYCLLILNSYSFPRYKTNMVEQGILI